MRRRAAQVLLLSVLALAGCGGAKSDEDAVRDAVRSSFQSTDPADCAPGNSQTAAFLRQVTFASPSVQDLYEQRCRANPTRFAATEVSVAAVKVTGDAADATFHATGGQYAFARATAALKKSDGRWRLDRLESVRLDRPAYDRRQAQLASGVGGLSAADAACFSRRLAKVADAALERAIVAAQPAVFADAFLVCFIRPELRKGGLTLSATRCVVVRLRRDPERLMRLVFGGTKSAQRTLQRDVARAARSCTAR
ncbi:MAG: hypothetical protein QOG15_1609 [Solirubrobacteraceae bacterium]|nr:hypothetical protein [Solirubrobacteraceae bacterium]